MFSEDEQFETWAVRALSHTPFGGADFGECAVTMDGVEPGDGDGWHRAWVATGERVAAIARESAAAGRHASAADAYLRASNYLRTATPFLFERHPSELLRETVAAANDAFAGALANLDHPAERVEIPFEGRTLPGWLIRAHEETAPLLVANNGYDSLVGELYFAHAVPALRRGYHCLLFDGPGQGAALLERGLVMRPDWETVIVPVLDHALTLPGVDPERVALIGWSLGGYLAPRGASGEGRLAALVTDPAQFDLVSQMAGGLRAFGFDDEEIAHLSEASDERLAPVIAAVTAQPRMAWALGQRALMVHGLDTVEDYFRAIGDYTLAGRAELIDCPTLVGSAEGDPLSLTSGRVYDALRCARTAVRYTAAEGAGGHCETSARTLVHQRTFDWLDGVLA